MRLSAPVQPQAKRWIVPLPRGAEPPYRVFVNGVPQEEGDSSHTLSQAELAVSFA